jgi:scyllo-inositol 2-dehydrogenase (NADP+)
MRIALIGYGLAGRLFHGRLLAATPGLRVVAIVTADEQRRAEAQSDFPSARLYDRPEALWDDAATFELAVVATSTPSHVSLARAAIETGRHVVVEKPLAPTAAQARELVDEARARGVLVVPFLNRRWDSDHLTVQRLVHDGALGTVLRYESRFERWRPNPSPGAWREEVPPVEGGGVLLDLGTHLIDQALSLHGPAQRVYAEMSARRGGTDDDVFIAVQHSSGVISHLWANAVAAAPGPRLRVLGTRAGYVVEDLDGQEEALRTGHSPDEPSFGLEPRERWGRLISGGDAVEVEPERGRWLRFYAALEQSLRGDAPPPVAAADAVAGLDVLDGARESARTGSVVRLVGT